MRDEPMWDQPEVHDVYRRWHDVLAKYDGDRMLVAEAWTQTPESMARYIRPDEMSQAFNFSWLLADWSADAFAEVITGTLDCGRARRRHRHLGAQQPRRGAAPHPLRRRRAVGLARARAATLTMLGAARLVVPLPGRGARPGAGRRARRLPAGPVLVPHRRGRPRRLPGAGPVGAATPRRTASARATGQPWIPQPADWAGLTVAAQDADPDSTLSFYRAALAARRYVREQRARGRDDRPRRRRAGVPPRPADRGAQLRHRAGRAARGRGAGRQRPAATARCRPTRRSGCADAGRPGRAGGQSAGGAFSSAAL